MKKGPLNYTGGKYRLLPKILPEMPEDIGVFVDLFAGGMNVAINVESEYKLCNDIEWHVIDMYKELKGKTPQEAEAEVDEVISMYKLDKENREGFNECRSYYNSLPDEEKDWSIFYSIVSHAFNYQIRFNLSGGYNMPFGKNRSSFNPRLRKRFREFVEELNTNREKYEFTSKDFRDVDLSYLGEEDMVYIDPPYMITTATYNEQGGWTEEIEQDLYDYIDKLDEQGVKFMMSNVFENKGLENTMLKEWSKRYNVKYLDHSYSNSNYQSSDKGKSTTVEVLIKNY